MLVVTDPVETYSRQRSWNVSAYAPSDCVIPYSWQCRQETLPLLHPLSRLHYHCTSCLFSDHYRCHRLLRAHLSPSSPFVAAPMPLLVRSCPLSTLTTPAAVLLETTCFAITSVSRAGPLSSLPRGQSPPRRCLPCHGQCYRHGRYPCSPTPAVAQNNSRCGILESSVASSSSPQEPSAAALPTAVYFPSGSVILSVVPVRSINTL